MLERLLISTATLFAMSGIWLTIQRRLQRDRTQGGIDYLKGRWGCGSCASDDTCASESSGHGHACVGPNGRDQSPTP